MEHTFNIPITINSGQCHNVLDTACMHIGYWESPFRRHKRNDTNDLVSVQVLCTDGVVGLGQPIEGEWWLIDEHVIIAGLKRIALGELTIAPSIRASILKMLANEDDCDITYVDASEADCIVQAGLFGELVYG